MAIWNWLESSCVARLNGFSLSHVATLEWSPRRSVCDPLLLMGMTPRFLLTSVILCAQTVLAGHASGALRLWSVEHGRVFSINDERRAATAAAMESKRPPALSLGNAGGGKSVDSDALLPLPVAVVDPSLAVHAEQPVARRLSAASWSANGLLFATASPTAGVTLYMDVPAALEQEAEGVERAVQVLRLSQSQSQNKQISALLAIATQAMQVVARQTRSHWRRVMSSSGQ